MAHVHNREADVVVFKFQAMVYDSKSIKEPQTEHWTWVEQSCILWTAFYAITAH